MYFPELEKCEGKSEGMMLQEPIEASLLPIN